jgi:hypothetical protein
VAGRRRTWLDGRVDVLLAALDEYGMSASVVSAAELIQERVQWVAAAPAGHARDGTQVPDR